MKPNLTFYKLSAVLLAAVIFGTSCQKSISEKSSSNNAAAQQKVNLTNTVIDASTSEDENFDMIMEGDAYTNASAASSNAMAITLSGTGGTVTYSPAKNVYPHTKTIDYGTGVTDDHGNTRSGKIIITYFNPSSIEKGRFTWTNYDNYHLNGVLVEGHIRVHKDVTKEGRSVYVHFIHKTLSDGSGDVKKYNGYSRWVLIDWQGGTGNAYQITEYNAGTETMNGTETSNFITKVDGANPVIKVIGCRRVQGLLTAKIHMDNPTPGNPADLDENLDYGNGDCDNMATLSVNGGEPQAVNLPLQFWPLNL